MAEKLDSKKYFENALKSVKEDLKINNDFALPQIDKVVINVGVGKMEKAQIEEITDQIEKLTAQIPRQIKSRISIAGFKMRAGEIVGVSTTLRGQKMKDFIFNTVYLALPRTKDFRGISSEAFDSNYSSYSIGIPDASIYPQLGFNTKVSFGMQVTVSFKQAGKNNKNLLEALKFPFKK